MADRHAIPKSLVTPLLPKSPVIFEAGAHVGVDTIEMARLWPHSHIYAFEPVPSVYDRLCHNVRSLDNVKCYPVALGGSSARRPLHVSSGESDGSSSLLRPSGHLEFHPGTRFEEVIEVEVSSIADFSRKHNVTEVHFLWLDVQGCELEVLRGMGSLLSTVRAIHLEVSLANVYDGAPLYHEVRCWLEREGFAVHAESLPWRDMGNVLFARMDGSGPVDSNARRGGRNA